MGDELLADIGRLEHAKWRCDPSNASLDGNATDVKVIGNRIYVATETRFYTLLRP